MGKAYPTRVERPAQQTLPNMSVRRRADRRAADFADLCGRGLGRGLAVFGQRPVFDVVGQDQRHQDGGKPARALASVARRQKRAPIGPRRPALPSLRPRTYIEWCRRKPAMAINGLRNKPFGPGGSARRLHHQRPLSFTGRPLLMGAKQDRRGRKGCSFARYGTRRYRAKRIVANDNYAPVAQAA